MKKILLLLMASSLFIGCAIKGGTIKGCSAKGCGTKGCCINKTVNNTEPSETKEPVEPAEPVVTRYHIPSPLWALRSRLARLRRTLASSGTLAHVGRWSIRAAAVHTQLRVSPQGGARHGPSYSGARSAVAITP